ncbi:hypothetical protein HGM15179_010351 [Zosterops borbonicus]|uniref:Uncharacterized protein n=1 Tax=Zosterops borbonicus TaxID=364589 RepID=A0A8K1LK92_9PASS|nr:hypothetical protein HGM15179_010351 [Zosterops borbonicus]
MGNFVPDTLVLSEDLRTLNYDMTRGYTTTDEASDLQSQPEHTKTKEERQVILSSSIEEIKGVISGGPLT